jgi:hypothetical protein
MRDLQPSDHGRRFSAKINDTSTEGRISYDKKSNQYYLCQNKASGANEGDFLGYKYTYWVKSSTYSLMNSHIIKDFKFINMTAKEIEEYKDFKKGDVLKFKSINKEHKVGKLEIIEKLGSLSFVRTEDRTCITTFITENLYKMGWRLDITSEEETPVIIELSVAEIAMRLGYEANQLKVVDK